MCPAKKVFSSISQSIFLPLLGNPACKSWVLGVPTWYGAGSSLGFVGQELFVHFSPSCILSRDTTSTGSRGWSRRSGLGFFGRELLEGFSFDLLGHGGVIFHRAKNRSGCFGLFANGFDHFHGCSQQRR